MSSLKKIQLTADDIITDEDFVALQSWIGTRPRLSQGPLVKEFEAEQRARR